MGWNLFSSWKRWVSWSVDGVVRYLWPPALFTVTGIGLLPWRVVDTYRASSSVYHACTDPSYFQGIIQIWKLKRISTRLRRKAGLPALYDENDLPVKPIVFRRSSGLGINVKCNRIHSMIRTMFMYLPTISKWSYRTVGKLSPEMNVSWTELGQNRKSSQHHKHGTGRTVRRPIEYVFIAIHFSSLNINVGVSYRVSWKVMRNNMTFNASPNKP